MLESCGVDDILDSCHGHFQSSLVSNVTNKIAQTGMLLIAELLVHLVLFQLIAREDDKTSRFVTLQNRTYKSLAEGACPAGDEYRLTIQIRRGLKKIADHLDVSRKMSLR